MNYRLLMPNQSSLIVPDDVELAIVRDQVAMTAFPSQLKPGDMITVRAASLATKGESLESGRDLVVGAEPGPR